MASLVPLTLHQSNDEIVLVTITRQDTDDDLSLLTGLEVVLKPDACSADDDELALVLSTTTPGQVTITSQSASTVTATVNIPAAALALPYGRFWRVDGLVGASRRTALYGPVTVVNL